VSELFQQLVNGSTLGCVYALVALGFTMVFGVLELIAFAHGGVVMVAAFAGLGVATALGGSSGWVIPLTITVLVAGLAGGALNVAIDRVAYRPLRGAGRLAPLISGIGVYMFLENAAGAWIGRSAKPFPSLLPAGAFVVGGVHVTYAQLVVVAISAVCMVALWALVTRTDTGLTMRAVAERPGTASLMGIEPERVIMVTFLVGGGLAGVAGVLVGTFVGVATPTMGFLISVKAFAAAVIGGIGNIPGALLGGIVVGLVETLGAGYISSAWSDAIVFAALIGVLVVRPHGLLGVRVPERA
jgi:branched-chain amino acid transport system permease protein